LQSSAQLVAEQVDGEPHLNVEAGEASVLLLRTRWGAGGLAVEHTWGEIEMELPPSMRPGDVVHLAGDAKAEYAEGHSVSSYRSQRLKGSLRVLAIDEDSAELDIDLLATEPVIDRERRGNVRLKGVLGAKRVSRRLDCF
jgi:hypothetical protein